jgi:hypothetical protein
MGEGLSAIALTGVAVERARPAIPAFTAAGAIVVPYADLLNEPSVL